jgi:hypothetical protein
MISYWNNSVLRSSNNLSQYRSKTARAGKEMISSEKAEKEEN